MKKISILCGLFLSFSISGQFKVEAFMPEIIKQYPNVRDIAISPEEDELFFSVQSFLGEISALVTRRKIAGKWQQPEIAFFSGQYFDIEPSYSPDGLKLFFASNRPLNATKTKSKDFDIWYIERTSKNGKWSQPINLGAPINTKADEFYPSTAKNNNLYYTTITKEPDQKDDIYFSTWKNGKYTSPSVLENTINSIGYEFNAFIAPDESYLIYTAYNRKDGLGSGDLYISYKNDNGQWSQARNMGTTINSTKMDYCPFVNTKNNTLYFTSKRNFIKTSFSQKQNLEELLQEMNRYDNGLSRLYKINIDSLIIKK